MKLFIVSNRLPVTLVKEGKHLDFRESTGGLASGISSYLDTLRGTSFTDQPYLWVGWPGATIAQKNSERLRHQLRQRFNAVPILLTEQEMDKFYDGFCNKTVWPLFHYFPSLTTYDQSYWDSYLDVNRIFADVLTPLVEPDDIIWIHDYHLMLLPKMIRERHRSVRCGFFLHIPFPAYEVFRLLPAEWRHQLLEGMLGADLIGFHTHDYSQEFLKCVLRILGFEHKLGKIFLTDRILRVDTFPMGIDYKRFQNALSDEGVIAACRTQAGRVPKIKNILSIDRLDYTKGLINRLQAYEKFLIDYPEWHERISFTLLLVPSRTRVEHYQKMKQQIDELVGKINGRFSTLEWIPIHYFYNFMSFHELVALYSCSAIALITPLRDGMNLVCKEYLACRPDHRGVLILSEMAGAAKELGEAIIVNPNNIEEMENAIKDALSMPVEEQIRRNTSMQERLQRYDVVRWASDFFEQLDITQVEQKKLYSKYLCNQIKLELLDSYQKAGSRVLLLDYDGTLTPFHLRPEKAAPSKELLTNLQLLTRAAKTHVVLISGRNKNTLGHWFSKVPGLQLVAEHGVWLKESGKSWRLYQDMDGSWKQSVRPLLEIYTDRLPGSFIEEKDFSLVWHYRAAESDLALLRSLELMDDLVHFTTNMDLQILPGNKVIEVKNFGMHKGNAALFWIKRYQPDFILALGDDVTDEAVFNVLPPEAYSIKVGFQLSYARYFLYNSKEVNELLQELLIHTGRA